MNWERTFSHCRMVTRAALKDGPANILERIGLGLIEDLRGSLHDAGWRYCELIGPLAPRITLHLADKPSIYTDAVVLRVETRALQLLNPDPMPDLGIFRRRRRAA